MSGKLAIFENPEFDNIIAREEIHSYHPTTNSFENNDEIEIVINQQDVLLSLSESALCIEGKIDITTDGKGDVSITNNFGAFLFDFISYELNGVEIDRVRDPGILTLIKTFLTNSENESKVLEMSSFIWAKSSFALHNGAFSLRIPLSQLFGLFTDYKRVLRGKHRLRLVRSRTDNNCYRLTLNAADESATNLNKISVKITNIELKAKHVYPVDSFKLKMLKNIERNDGILIPFRKWDLHELPVLRRTDKEIWAVKTSVNLERPKYVIIAFQVDRKENAKRNVSFFDPVNITDCKVYLNSDCYPYESMRLDFDKGRYTEAYQMYSDFQRSFFSHERNEPLLSYGDFSKRTIFVIDTSKHDNDVVLTSTCDIRIEFQSSETFPDKTRAFCIIIHDCIFENNPLTGIVRQIT